MNTKEIIAVLKQDTDYLEGLEEEQVLLKKIKVEGNDKVSWQDWNTATEKVEESLLKDIIKLGIAEKILVNDKAILQTIQNIERLTNEFNNTDE